MEHLPVKKNQFLLNKYETILKLAIQSPIKVAILSLLTFVTVIFLYGKLGTGVQFFPDDKADGARINVTARGNLTTEEKTKYINEVIEIVDANSNVQNYVANTVQRKHIWISDEILDPSIIIDKLKKDFEKIVGYGIEVKENSISSVLNAGKPIEIEVSSADVRLLGQTAEIIKSKLNSINGIENAEIIYPISGLEWRYDIDRKQTGKYDIPIQSIGAIINLATDGLKIGTMRPKDTDELDIKIFLPEGERTLDNLETLKINTKKGAIQVSEFIIKKPVDKIFSIGRKNGARNLVINADITKGVNTAEMISKIKAWKNSTSLPLAVDIKFLGEAEDSQSSINFVVSAFVFALLAMFMILICLFNNFYHTFIILFSLVLSTTGIFVGLIVLQMNFNIIMTGLGIVACAGIVVNNNIILIDSYRKIRKDEPDKIKAIILSTKSRIRPILLTNITTVIGILPSALQLSINIFDRTISYKSAETYFTEPLAWALVWGLSFAAVATLIVTPALLALPDALKSLFGKRYSQIVVN
jgi:multidrug efflux pump